MSEPTYIVKLRGMVRESDMQRFKEKIEQQLDGNVVIIDEHVADIEMLSPEDKFNLVKLLAGDDWKEIEAS